ncbi:hypothetical protein LSCM1_03164 [Leishmania martiniquensis]|uniref:C3H1-type domain-containing protein n=1 Tax=Leishmania martiniquensis TaxID=1580590 RepID=A0A836GL47_9TRYP|nr:hypothetical protein LSCM1_03164 [Leishmania martiniquensis]
MHSAQDASSPASAGPVTRTIPSPHSQSPTNHTTGPRLFTHAPYLSTVNIIASEDMGAVELAALDEVDGKRSGLSRRHGSPSSGGLNRSVSSFNASHNSTNQLRSPHAYQSGRKNVCRHFLNGSCNRGSSCHFYHPGPIHRVITPTRPHTPTQRPLTPLADLAQQSSTLVVQSPTQSPYMGPTSAPLRSSPRVPWMTLSIGGGSACSNSESVASPTSSPSTSFSAQRSTAFVESLAQVVAATPALSSPSIGPQFIPGTSLGTRARCGHGVNLLPSLQLPDYVPTGSDDGTMEGGNSATAEDAGPLSRLHSPSSPVSCRMSMYRGGVQPGASCNSSCGERMEGLANSHPHVFAGNVFLTAASDAVPSPTSAGVTRNHPYAYAPARVQRHPSQLMSPLKHTPNGLQ